MSMRSKLFALLGVFLLGGVSSAQADHIGFTINGQSNEQVYQCVAPCTVEVYDPDGGSYDWDFEYNISFAADVTGNPVSWTYETAERYTIAESADGGATLSLGGVEVIPADEGGPEDIELVSPANGLVPRELEFTTTRRQLQLVGCGGSPCRSGATRLTGPDGNGRYHHFVRLEEAPDQGTLSVAAWNTDSSYAVRDYFPITTTGRLDPFTEGTAKWKARQAGGRCVLRFSKRFSVSGPYEAKLKLLGKAKGLRVSEKVSSSGEGGQSLARAKLTLSGTELEKLPGKVSARLKVTVEGEPYTTKDRRPLKAGCR